MLADHLLRALLELAAATTAKASKFYFTLTTVVTGVGIPVFSLKSAGSMTVPALSLLLSCSAAAFAVDLVRGKIYITILAAALSNSFAPSRTLSAVFLVVAVLIARSAYYCHLPTRAALETANHYRTSSTTVAGLRLPFTESSRVGISVLFRIVLLVGGYIGSFGSICFDADRAAFRIVHSDHKVEILTELELASAGETFLHAHRLLDLLLASRAGVLLRKGLAIAEANLALLEILLL